MADINKLKNAGFGTSMSIVATMKKNLLEIKGLSEQKVEKIVEAATKLSFSKSFYDANEMLVKLRSRFKISTGASTLDSLLKGGIESGQITELYGEFRTGKTQMAHSLSVQAQLHPENPGRCLFVDTEGTFRPDRIAEIAKALGFEEQQDDVMKNILVGRCLTSEHLFRLLSEAAVLMVDEEQPFSLIIVDSIMGLFRTDYSGRGELADRQQALGKILNRLQKMAEEFNVAVVVCNQVMADPSGAMATFNAPPKPVGGHVLAHAVSTRLYFRKGKGEERVCKIIDSPCLPEGEAPIQIYEGGIRAPDGLS